MQELLYVYATTGFPCEITGNIGLYLEKEGCGWCDLPEQHLVLLKHMLDGKICPWAFVV